MKTTQKMNLRPTRLVLLLGAIGFATIGAQAQQAANADARGKMIDNSSTLPLPYLRCSSSRAPRRTVRAFRRL